MKRAWQLFESLVKLSLLISVLSDFWTDRVTIKTVCVLLIIIWSVLLEKKTIINVYEKEKES